MRYEGRFYYHGEIVEGCIEIEDGKIKRIKKSMDNCEKLKGIIFPGGVDIHVHFRDPGYTEKEDFYTGTMAAAYGGITFAMDMPNTNPPVSSPDIFDEKLKIASGKANIDFSLYSLLNESSEELMRRNPAFKLYMYEQDVRYQKNSFISVHAELKECIGKGRNLMEYDFARPEKCEVKAIKKLINVGKFHIAHISSVDSIDMCKIGGFTCEVTPHHLFLHRDMNLSTFGKVNPPLREKWVGQHLFQNLLNGRIDIVASDHAPHTIEEKSDEFEVVPPGIPEVETYIPIFLYLIKTGEISLRRGVEVLMEKPAEIVGVKKGKIEVGYDGDLIAVDMGDVRKIRSREIHYKCGWTPYENFNGIFPHTVILRGEKILEDGEIIGERMGKFIKIMSSSKSLQGQ